MQLPKDYEQATAADGRSIRMLPPGGYVCQIKAAAVNERNGKKRLEILYDVFEGEYKDFFTKQYQTGFDKGYDPQWRGVYGVNVLTNAGNTNPFFKGLLTAVQKTNPNAVLVQNGVLNEGAMLSKRKFEKDYQRIGYITKTLKDMSTDLNIAVIALAQVGRETEKAMPSLADLRGSGDLEQDADNVIFLHRPESADDKSLNPRDIPDFDAIRAGGKQVIIAGVAKQRQGEIGKCTMIFDPARMTYYGIERRKTL